MDILFWSGGKDAYLALIFYRRRHPQRSLRLLTTYSAARDLVPHQRIPIPHIHRQAGALGLDLITVPLPDDCPNEEYLSRVDEAIRSREEPEHLLFGDWHLADIRRWREEQFQQLGYACLFPIWKMDLNELLPALLLQPVDVQISAVADRYRELIRVGETYNHHFVRQLPETIDPMGEGGEFHTEVRFKSWHKLRDGKQGLQ